MDDLFLRTLRGETTSRRPLWIMRQAGRYLPEYRALRRRHEFERLLADVELATRISLLPLERFDLDAAIVFADIMSPIAALGIDVHFAPGPIVDPPIRTVSQVEAMPDPDRIDGPIAPQVLATVRAVRREVDGRAAVLGFVGAPLTLAAYLVQGHGKTSFPYLRAFAYSEPKTFELLLERLTRLVARYAAAQVEAGAQAIQIFDSWAGLLSLADWHRWIRPHLLHLLERLAEAGAPTILFALDAPHIVPSLCDLPADVLAVDWRQDLPALRRQLGPTRILQGNLDPAILLGGPDATRGAALELMQRLPARGHVFNLGHGILPDTPLDSVDALIDAVHNEPR